MQDSSDQKILVSIQTCGFPCCVPIVKGLLMLVMKGFIGRRARKRVSSSLSQEAFLPHRRSLSFLSFKQRNVRMDFAAGSGDTGCLFWHRRRSRQTFEQLLELAVDVQGQEAACFVAARGAGTHRQYSQQRCGGGAA